MKKWDKGRKQAPDDEEADELDYEEEGYGESDYEELDFDDEQEWQDEEEPEEDDGLSTWVKAALFLGMVVLAAIICAVLWYFTHPNKSEDGGQDNFAEGEAGEENGSGTESGGNAGRRGEIRTGRSPGCRSGTGSIRRSGGGQPVRFEQWDRRGEAFGRRRRSRHGNRCGNFAGSRRRDGTVGKQLCRGYGQ